MTTLIPPLGIQDADGNPIGGQGYDPASHGFTARQSGPALNDPVTGIPYAPTVLGGNSGLPLNLPVPVQKAGGKSTGSVASLAQAFASANVAGNSIIVVAGCGNGTAMTVADSAGNTYTQAVTTPNSTTFEVAIFFAVNIVGGANIVTVTNAGSAASMAVEIYEYSGLLVQTGGQPGQTISNTGTGTTASTSNISAGTPNQIAFAGIAVGTAAQTITPAAGWTNDSGQQNPTTPAGLFSFASLSEFLPNIGNVTPSATLAGSEPWAVAVATFRPVVLGVEGTVRIAGYNYTRVTTAATTLVKQGPGVLHAVIVNKPTATATIELDDALTNTTPIIGIMLMPTTAANPFTVVYDVAFATGLSVTVGVATVDATIVWK